MFLNNKIITSYILFISLILFYSCTEIKKEARHKPSALSSSYSFETQKPFSEYIKDTRKIITESIKLKNIKQ